jgi:hypothetical protein
VTLVSKPKQGAPVGPEPGAPTLVVPRAWLIALAALIVAPWLVAAAVYWWPDASEAPGLAAAPPQPPGAAGKPGPWGTLDVTTVVISPPLELVGSEWERREAAGKHWFFPGTTAEAAQGFLLSAGLGGDRVASIMATAQRDPASNGIVLTPGADLVSALPPEIRQRIYVQLAASPLNVNQAFAFRYAGDSVEAWLGPSLISPRTRQLVEPLVYRHQNYLYFADVDLVRTQVTDREELLRLAKALLRQTTSRVRLSVSTPAEVPGLVEYWGRGGRRLDIRPLLESIAGGGTDGTLDIVHLLPSFARERLYRYPLVTAQDLNRPALANCLWTVLNFFSPAPDDRFLDVATAIRSLQQDYYLVDSRFQLGDIVALLDEQGDIYHAVVYLADDLVFTKIGGSPLAPWVILPLSSVVDYYRLRSAAPRLVYHRRRDQ